ncbi:MAG: MFS transporter [Phycisphaerae bacterium]
MPDPGSEKKFRLPRNVIALGLVSLFTDISSEMLYPIIPFFLRGTLGAPLWAIGVVEGAADGMSSLLRGLSGYLSDKFRRRKIFVFLGYTASALAKPITVLAQSWGFVLGTRLLDRFGKSIRTAPRDALISDQVSSENRGYAFGFHRAMDTVGAVLGPVLTLVLVWHFGFAYRRIFLLACIPAAIGVVIVIVAVRESRKSDSGQKSSTPHAHIPAGKWISPSLVKFFIVTALFALANSSNTFIILRAQDIFKTYLHAPVVDGTRHTNADALAIIGYVLFNLSFALLATPMGILSDRLGRKKIIVVGYLVYALVYGALAFWANFYTIWAIFLVYGIFEAMTHGVTKALVADLAPAEYRGTALGVSNTIEGVGTFTAGIAMGFLWQWFGPELAFSVGAVLALSAAILFLAFRLTPQTIKSDNTKE